MKNYTYYFADGTTNTIELEDKWFDILTELDKQESSNNRRETRRHQSLNQSLDNGHDFEDKSINIENACIISDEISQALSILSADQKEVVMLIYFKGYQQSEVANIRGVTPATINKQLSRAKTNLKKYFKKLSGTANFNAFSWLLSEEVNLTIPNGGKTNE